MRTIAEFLSVHPRVGAVYCPGLGSHPQAVLVRRQMCNFSGLLAFAVKGDGAAVARQLAEPLVKTVSLVFYIPIDEGRATKCASASLPS
jgi:cystathionine beta-lyase/cystathionine gamma-synthase